MNYTPTNAVWELTYACNMRCKHCGSSCGEKYPDELSSEEALSLCDDLASLGLKVVTLSGGEPFLRKDWDLIAKRLVEKGVTVNAISNGWYIDEALIEKASRSGIVNIGVSLDGLEKTHDFMRMKGSYERVLRALDTMNEKGMSTVVCTSVNKMNLPEFPRMYDIILEKKVQRWQFQIASPMGNLLEHKELIIEPREVDDLIDFTFDVASKGHVIVDLADDIGYYNTKISEIRKLGSTDKDTFTVWAGCNAGKCVLGIRANGDISGCLSIRDPDFIEGNIRDVPLAEMWTSPDAFSWTRKLTKSQLRGFCVKCQYGRYCLGGCTGAKITLSGDLYDNKYCSFRLEIEREADRVSSMTDTADLIAMANKSIADEGYQWAEVYLSRAIELDPGNIEISNLLGLSHYFLENYEDAKKYSLRALAIDSSDSYAHKGLGLALVKLGSVDEGIGYLKKAIELTDDTFLDPYFDCALVLGEQGRTVEAIAILEKGRSLSESFTKGSENLYEALRKQQAETSAKK
jgi:radical SAM protein with 4Fe4S-binding SPASM domain